MKFKFKYLIVIFFLSPVVFFFIRSLFVPSNLCNLLTDFKKSNYHAIVIDKFLDQKNHRTRTVIIKSKESSFNLILPRDTSNFFDYIDKGDSLIKEMQKNFLTVKRGDSLKIFKIYFGCNE